MNWKYLLVPVLVSVGLPAQTDPDGKMERGFSTGPATEGRDPATNMTVVRQWARPGTQTFSDIWGWSSPDGREFAYIGEHSGIWFVETTDPSNIKEIGHWTAPGSSWRDFTNLGPYVYSVSEHHRGIRVFDMRNPGAPRDLGTVETRTIRSSHNISADPATNHLYVSGTNQGLVVLDASQSRTNPRVVSTWNTTYTHDCCVRNGYAYLANGGLSVARIMDASNPGQLREIGSLNSPGGYSHNVWVSEDGQLLCHTDEAARTTSGAQMSIWDISNPRAPIARGQFDLTSIVHNVFVVGRTAYMSHYVNGVQVVDLSDPYKPHLIASYDTSNIAQGFAGCWGVYPFSDSGLIYVSDISKGLFVLRQDRGHLNRFGKGLAGSNGLVPRMRFDGSAPRVGGSKLRIEIENLRPNASFYLLVSGGIGQGSLFGVPLHVNLASTFVLPLKANSNGKLSIPAPVPNDKSLARSPFYLQILARDTGLAGGFSSSRGMWTGIAR